MKPTEELHARVLDLFTKIGLEDPKDVADKFIANLKLNRVPVEEMAMDILHGHDGILITPAFTWHDSPEGFDYWSEIQSLLIAYLQRDESN